MNSKFLISLFLLAFVWFSAQAGGERTLIQVGGLSCSEADYAQGWAFHESLLTFRAGKGASTTRFARQLKEIKKGMPLMLVARMAIIDEAKRRNVVVDENILEKQRVKYATSVRRCKSYEDLRAEMGRFGHAADLDRTVSEDALIETFWQKNFSNELTVTEQQVREVRERTLAANARAVVTNRALYAFATNLCKRIRGGEDFAALADKYSQDKGMDPGGKIGVCTAVDFEDEPDKWAILSSLKVGQITDPLDMDECLAIYKRVEPEDSEWADGVWLARICLYRAVTFMTTDEAGIRTELARYKRTTVCGRETEKLIQNTVIRFPSGFDMFDKDVVGKLKKLEKREK